MKTFTDNNGRAWALIINVATLKRVRALCDVDLTKVVELDEKGQPCTKLLEQLSSDPVLLVDVLYAICKPECDRQNISDEDFGTAMAGDAIDHAASALLDEIVDFFPAAKRLTFQKVLTATRRFEAIARKKLESLLADGKFEDQLVSELERSVGLSTNAQASAE